MFRHLFFTKYVERRLLATWKEHQALRELELHDGQSATHTDETTP